MIFFQSISYISILVSERIRQHVSKALISGSNWPTMVTHLSAAHWQDPDTFLPKLVHNCRYSAIYLTRMSSVNFKAMILPLSQSSQNQLFLLKSPPAYSWAPPLFCFLCGTSNCPAIHFASWLAEAVQLQDKHLSDRCDMEAGSCLRTCVRTGNHIDAGKDKCVKMLF